MPALDHFPHRVWGRLLWRHGKRQSSALMAYGDPAGHVPLREAIAEYLGVARGVRCDAAHVLIVSGSQMALQLCAMALLAPGDAVCVEEPGYPGARDALRTSGATGPIPLDARIDVGRLRHRRARLVYVTPSHQYHSASAARPPPSSRAGGNRWIVGAATTQYTTPNGHWRVRGWIAARVIYIGTSGCCPRCGSYVMVRALWDLSGCARPRHLRRRSRRYPRRLLREPLRPASPPFCKLYLAAATLVSGSVRASATSCHLLRGRRPAPLRLPAPPKIVRCSAGQRREHHRDRARRATPASQRAAAFGFGPTSAS
jgi:hypothetical protein